MTAERGRLAFFARVTGQPTRGGALELLTKETSVTHGGQRVAEVVSVTVVRNPSAGT